MVKLVRSLFFRFKVILRYIYSYTRNEHFRSVIRYSKYQKKLNIDKKVIFFEEADSSGKRGVSFIFIENILKEPFFSDFTFIWTRTEKSKGYENELKSCGRVKFCKRGSMMYTKYLANAGYLINGQDFPDYFVKRDDQVYIKGFDPAVLKGIEKNQDNTSKQRKNTVRNCLHADYLFLSKESEKCMVMRSLGIQDLYQGSILYRKNSVKEYCEKIFYNKETNKDNKLLDGKKKKILIPCSMEPKEAETDWIIHFSNFLDYQQYDLTILCMGRNTTDKTKPIKKLHYRTSILYGTDSLKRTFTQYFFRALEKTLSMKERISYLEQHKKAYQLELKSLTGNIKYDIGIVPSAEYTKYNTLMLNCEIKNKMLLIHAGRKKSVNFPDKYFYDKVNYIITNDRMNEEYIRKSFNGKNVCMLDDFQKEKTPLEMMAAALENDLEKLWKYQQQLNEAYTFEMHQENVETNDFDENFMPEQIIEEVHQKIRDVLNTIDAKHQTDLQSPNELVMLKLYKLF